MSSINDKIAIITGAGSGIGKAIAIECSRHYSALCLVGRSLDKLESVADSARAFCSNVSCHSVDLTSYNEKKNFSIKIKRKFEKIDALIHSAGIYSHGDFESSTLEEFDRVYFTNVRGPFYLTQLLISHLKNSKGQIVFINSSVVINGSKQNISHYSASKFALKAIADSLREEVNNHGVRVISVYPGRTASRLQKKIHEVEGKIYLPEILSQPEDIAKIVINSLFIPRSSEVTDIVVRPMKKGH